MRKKMENIINKSKNALSILEKAKREKSPERRSRFAARISYQW